MGKHYRLVWTATGTLTGEAGWLSPDHLRNGFHAHQETSAMILMHDGSVWEAYRGSTAPDLGFYVEGSSPQEEGHRREEEIARALRSERADLDRAAQWLFGAVVIARYEPVSPQAKALRLRVERGEP